MVLLDLVAISMPCILKGRCMLEVVMNCLGLCRIDVYTLATNSWRRSPIKSFYSYFAMTTLNDQLITAGGENEDYKTTNRICYLQGNKLKRYTRMTTPRCYAAAAGILIVTGGLDNECSRLATTEPFDSSTGGWFNTGQWYTAGELPFADCQLNPVIADNVLYVFSRLNTYSAPLDTLYSFQLNWSNLDPKNRLSRPNSALVSMQGSHLLDALTKVITPLVMYTCSTSLPRSGR